MTRARRGKAADASFALVSERITKDGRASAFPVLYVVQRKRKGLHCCNGSPLPTMIGPIQRDFSPLTTSASLKPGYCLHFDAAVRCRKVGASIWRCRDEPLFEVDPVRREIRPTVSCVIAVFYDCLVQSIAPGSLRSSLLLGFKCFMPFIRVAVRGRNFLVGFVLGGTFLLEILLPECVKAEKWPTIRMLAGKEWLFGE